MINDPTLECLNDQARLYQFGDLVRQDHEGNAQLIRHIDAIDRRQLWARLGHPSLFSFLVTRFHMSESTAGKRIGAARTARRFPVLFEMVARGEIHLSGIHRLKAHLTRENHEQVLAQAKHQTIRQIEELVARLAPQPDVPTTLRALPNRTTSSSPLTAPALGTPTLAPAPAPAPPLPSAHAAFGSPPKVEPAPTPLPPRRDPDPTPLSPGRYRLQLTVSQSTRDKLEQLRDLLAHQIPNGDPAVIFERALDALLELIHKQKIGATEKPRARRPSAVPRARWIPAALRREIWQRDQGRCSFVGEDGHHCNETRGLEFAHVKPWAKGFGHSASNLCLRCRAHNAWEADRDYGTGFMTSKRQRKPLKVREPVVRLYRSQ